MAIKSLCKKGVLLENGTLKETGNVDDIVAHYLRGDSSIENYHHWDIPQIKKDGFELLEIGVRKKNGDYNETMRVDNELELIIKYRITKPYEQLHLTFHMKNEQGMKMFSFSGASQVGLKHDVGEYEQICLFPANFFNWGNYSLDLYVVENRRRAFIIDNDTVSFTLSNKEAAIGSWMGKEPGDITPKFSFQEKEFSL